MDLPRITYLTFDPLSEGVGSSQVVPYVERLARRGMPIELHSFEREATPTSLASRLKDAGVDWRPRPFGAGGPAAGMGRTVRGAAAVRGAQLVHARSDLAAAAALLARPPAWIWDMRSFWIDQRISLGLASSASPSVTVMRRVERAAAASADAVVVLAAAAIDVLEERHGQDIRPRCHVIPTCVDTGAFPLAPMPAAEDALRLVLSGTLNRLYDVPASIRLAEALNRRRPTTLVALSPGPTSWDEALARPGVERHRSDPAGVPSYLANTHAGLCLLADRSVALKATVPTKVAELLSIGRPVVVTAGIGDLDAQIRGSGAGLVLSGTAPSDLDAAAEQIDELVADPQTPARCRALAVNSFDIEAGVDRLVEIYRDVARRL